MAWRKHSMHDQPLCERDRLHGRLGELCGSRNGLRSPLCSRAESTTCKLVICISRPSFSSSLSDTDHCSTWALLSLSLHLRIFTYNLGHSLLTLFPPTTSPVNTSKHIISPAVISPKCFPSGFIHIQCSNSGSLPEICPDCPSVKPLRFQSRKVAAMWMSIWRRCSWREGNVGIPDSCEYGKERWTGESVGLTVHEDAMTDRLQRRRPNS